MELQIQSCEKEGHLSMLNNSNREAISSIKKVSIERIIEVYKVNINKLYVFRI